MMQLLCECGRTLGYEPRHVGKQVRCPGCQRLHIVPAPVQQADAPRVREPHSPGFMRTVGELLCGVPAVSILVLMAAIGGALLITANSESKASAHATEVPRTVTCRQLIDEGPGDNRHVLVTDVIAGQNYFTRVKVTKAEQASGNTSNKPWEEVYLPLMPLTPEIKTRLARGEPFVPPPNSLIRVILVSHTIRNKEELAKAFTSEGAVQGMIVKSNTAGSETEKVLRQKYPGIESDEVLILEPGRKPSSKAFLMGLFVGGVGLLVLAGMLGVIAVVFRPKQRIN
jgi:hypothetical protein